MRIGWLYLTGWHGISQQRVEVLGFTPKRVRIRALQPTRLAGRRRSLRPGEIALVPTKAVKVEEAE